MYAIIILQASACMQRLLLSATELCVTASRRYRALAVATGISVYGYLSITATGTSEALKHS